MADYSLPCPTCARPTLHRSTEWGCLWPCVGLGLLAFFAPPEVSSLVVVALVIGGMFVPPAVIRCQTCGGVTSRAWGAWALRVALCLAILAGVQQLAAVRERAEAAHRGERMGP